MLVQHVAYVIVQHAAYVIVQHVVHAPTPVYMQWYLNGPAYEGSVDTKVLVHLNLVDWYAALQIRHGYINHGIDAQ